MAVAFVATSSTIYAVSTSQNVSIPTVSIGDLLIATVMHRDTLTPETGWTFVASATGSLTSPSVDQTVSVYKRVAQSGDSGSSTTWSQATSQRIATNIAAFSGDASLAVDDFATSNQTDVNTNLTPFAEVSPTDNFVGFAVGSNILANASPSATSVTPEAGWTLLSPSSIVENRLGISHKGLGASELTSGDYTHSFTSDTTGTSSVTLIISDASPVRPDIRATQIPILALGDVVPDSRITQSSFLVLSDVSPTARVTQLLALSLIEVIPDIRITQIPILVLADHVPCITKWAQTWTITRTDGQVFAFTSLDRNLTYRGVVHKSCDSLSSTATEMSSSAGSTGSMELAGLISDSSIKDIDLFNGLFDGANVEIWLVPWEDVGGEIPVRLLEGTLGDATQGLNGFVTEIITPGATMRQKPLLDFYTPGCPYKLGDSRCGFDLDTLEVTGSVTGLTIPNSPNSANKRVFIDSSRSEADGFFELGEVTWTSGDNNGLSVEVKDFTGTTFVLWRSLLKPIQIGDTYTAKPGCDKTVETCKTKFNIFVNYGGFPDVPGQDRIVQTPDSK